MCTKVYFFVCIHSHLNNRKRQSGESVFPAFRRPFPFSLSSEPFSYKFLYISFYSDIFFFSSLFYSAHRYTYATTNRIWKVRLLQNINKPFYSFHIESRFYENLQSILFYVIQHFKNASLNMMNHTIHVFLNNFPYNILSFIFIYKEYKNNKKRKFNRLFLLNITAALRCLIFDKI